MIALIYCEYSIFCHSVVITKDIFLKKLINYLRKICFFYAFIFNSFLTNFADSSIRSTRKFNLLLKSTSSYNYFKAKPRRFSAKDPKIRIILVLKFAWNELPAWPLASSNVATGAKNQISPHSYNKWEDVCMQAKLTTVTV